MVGRDRDEPHRAATPLELLFDLCFVVGVAQVAAQLHHSEAEAHFLEALLGYILVFFGIWWAWVNFTWFASAYDTDDVPYRVLTMLQIGGVLVLAAGVPAAFTTGDYRVAVAGYVIMRLVMVVQWLRAARECPSHAPLLAAVRAGHWTVPDRLGHSARAAGACRRRHVRRAGRGRAAGARLGRKLGPADPVAPRAHRRTLRTVHHHRARRMCPRGDGVAPGRGRGKWCSRPRWSRLARAACYWSARCGGPTSRARRLRYCAFRAWPRSRGGMGTSF